MSHSSQPPAVLWSPDEAAVEEANLTAFRTWLNTERGLELDSYAELWAYSVDDLPGFWSAIFEYFAVDATVGRGPVLGSEAMPGAEWFPGVSLNYAERVFRDRDPSVTAILHVSEHQDLAGLTWGELRSQVAAVAQALRARGVGRGDRVAGYLPNVPEAVVAFLATVSLGAVWSCCSPDFGAASVLDRLAQVEPKVLFVVDGYQYGGKVRDVWGTVESIREGLPSLVEVILVPRLSSVGGEDRGRKAHSVTLWDDILEEYDGAELVFDRVPFDWPLWILYSSGTTGLPKGITQGHGGILLEHLKFVSLHVDLKPGDRFFWYTTTGWMMWNIQVAGLLAGASIVLYDGNPAYPSLEALWDLAEAAAITHFGTSAAYLSSCMTSDLSPCDGRSLDALRAIGSTGSVLSPECFDWIYDAFAARTWLFSVSGGTDLCSALLGAVPVLPVTRGELQARCLGAAVESWDDEGRPRIGEVGELVVTRPMPSMPLYFWNDDDGSRYRESYFSMYPGIWRHGDWVEITERGTAVIYGRSDSTINRGGIRMGTSEIYRALLASPKVEDALVVDLPDTTGEGKIVLFVVLASGQTLDDDLRLELKQQIRTQCSPRHAPDVIREIEEVPRNLTGKVLEVPLKKILMGVPVNEVVQPGSVRNPGALQHFVELARTGWDRPPMRQGTNEYD